MGKASITIAVNAKWNGKQLDNAEKALRRLTTLSAASSKSTTADLVKQGGAWAELGGKIYNAGVKTEKVGKMLTQSVTVPLVAIGAYAGKTAVQFDTAMANVRKTTNLSNAEIEKLARSAQNLSTKQPVTAETLLNIEALGAQLGVAHGKLESFAEVVSGLDIATNMDFETAGKEMAQFANITQMSQDQFKNYGSTIVDLGNHLATTESDISSMALRLAGAGTAANFSQAEILGMSGAMSSLGIRAEAGGSAMTRIIQDISKNVAKGSDTVEEYARVAGMSADEFAAAWKSKPMEALEALVEGLKRTSDSGEDMNVTLEKLGINNIRNSDTMRRLANAGDLLRNSVDRANTAWEQNTALQNEVDQRNESLASRLQVLKNKVDSIAISIGRPLVNAVISALEACDPLIHGVGDLADAFSKMDAGQQQFVLAMVGIAAAAGPVLTVFGKLEQGVGSFVTALGKGSQDFAVWKDALNTTDGAQMRAYASADTLASKIGIAGNKAAEAAGGAENYVAAWQGYYQTSQHVIELEGKYATAVSKSKAAVKKSKTAADDYANAVKLAAAADDDGKVAVTEYAAKMKTKADAAKKAAQASIDNRNALLKEIQTTERANNVYGSMVDKFTGSSKETSKVAAEIAKAHSKTSASVLETAQALEKQAGAAKTSAGVMKTLGNGIKGLATGLAGMAGNFIAAVGPQLAFVASITAISAVVGDFIAQSQKAKEQAEKMSKAMQAGSSIMDNAARSADGLGDSIGDVSVNAEETTQKLIELNESIGETFTKVSTDSATLDNYVGVIDDLTKKSSLSATEQYRLGEAVKGYNEITGDSVAITNAATGELSKSTDEIDRNAAAWKRNAEMKALSNAASKYLQQEIEAEGKLEIAQAKVTEAQKANTAAINESTEYYKKHKEQIDKAMTSKTPNEYAKKWGQLNGEVTKTGQALKDAQGELDEIGGDFTSAAEKADYFSTRAAALAAGLDESSADMAGKIASSISTMGKGVRNSLDSAGINISDLAVKMQQAGITSEQMSSISKSSFKAMVNSCGGDIDTLVGLINGYNNAPIVDKDANISINDLQLKDAQGNVAVWNGSTLVDLKGNAIADDTSLTDAQGNVWTWNGSTLIPKHTTGTASGNVADGSAENQSKKYQETESKRSGKTTNHRASGNVVDGSGTRESERFTQSVNRIPKNHSTHISASADTSAINTFASALSRIPRTVTTFVSQIISKHGNAAGGIRPHAAGGVMMRYHANGAIANRPGAGVPLDIVGEAGAEAIVPLTNRKYSRPFARTIAEQMKQVSGGVSSQVVNNYTLNIDGSSIRGNDRARELIEALVSELV